MSFFDILSGPPEAWSNIYVNSLTLEPGPTGSLYTTDHIISGVTGASSTGNITLSLTKVGNIVSVNVGGYAATAGTTGTISTIVPIPLAFRNTSSYVVTYASFVSGSYSFGTLYLLASTGIMTFYPGAFGSVWNSGTPLAILPTAFSYNLS